MARAWREERWGHLGIPSLFWTAKPADCPPIAKFTALPEDILIVGPNGVGKSYAAAILAMSWGARWKAAQQILIDVRDTYGNSEKEYLDDITAAPALIVDDLCAAQKTDTSTSTLLYVLNRRMENGRPTVVTMDRSLSDLHQSGDTSMASRLGAFRVVTLKGKDRRLDHGVR